MVQTAERAKASKGTPRTVVTEMCMRLELAEHKMHTTIIPNMDLAAYLDGVDDNNLLKRVSSLKGS